MSGIRNSVKTQLKVITVIRDHQDSNAFDGIGSAGTTPSLAVVVDDVDKQLQEPSLLPRTNDQISHGLNQDDINHVIDCFPKTASVAKVSEVSSIFGKAGTTGFGMAVGLLDRLGSSMTKTSGMPRKGNKILILAFEFANTIVKGDNLMQSLSEENIRYLKEVVLPSKGVQTLISRDTDELLRISAADKREELTTFLRDVVRFGNYSKDPTWHNLDRYFKKISIYSSEYLVSTQKDFKKQTQTDMEQLMTFVRSTAELCHELHFLDRLEQDYLQKLKEHNSNAARKGDSLAILRTNQRKLVSCLKKKSLWSKTFEEVVEKLVDVVHLLHLMIHEAFGSADEERVESSERNHKKLGPAGIALHYAGIITQINTLVSLPPSSSVAQNMRNTLYQGLPCSVKSALRSKLPLVELTMPQIKAEMEKTLEWLVPIASNTTKALHSFGWVGEWANTEFEECWKQGGQTGILRIKTLHHADKAETEACIFKLVVWLHHLISQTGAAGNGGMPSTPIKPSNQKTHQLSTHKTANCSSTILTVEDQEMLQDVSKNNVRLGMSKSRNTSRNSNLIKHHRLSKSSGDSLASKTRNDPFPSRNLLSRKIDFDIDRFKLLDIIDGVETA